MNKFLRNPYINAIYAEVYIVIIAFVMRHVGAPDTPDNFFTPIGALSLLVLSAAVMAYVFLGEPVQLYLNGEKGQSVRFFMKTVMAFAVITIIALIVMAQASR